MTAWMSSMSSSYLATSSGALSAQYSLYQCGYGRFRNMSTYTFHLGGLQKEVPSGQEGAPGPLLSAADSALWHTKHKQLLHP